jgi:succinoglycan biosynthesis transport protein ExoP
MPDALVPTRKHHDPSEFDDDDTIDVMQYALALWHRRWMILATALVCAGAAAVLGLVSAQTYEASVKLVVAAPKTGAAGEAAPAISIATFRTLIESQASAATIIREFKLDAPPLNLSPSRFLAGHLTVEALRDTNVLEVTLRMPSKELAAKVANRLADLAVELAQHMSQEETVKARDFIKLQLDQSKARLDAAENRLEQYRKQAQVEAVRKDVEALLGQRGDLLKLLVDIQSERAELAKAEEQLKQRVLIGTLTRTIDSDPNLMEAAKERAKDQNVLGLQTKNEYVNEVYQRLDEQVATSRARLSGLEKQKSELVDVRHLNANQLVLLNQLYEREAELGRLQMEDDLAKKVYTDVATRYEEARLQVAGKTAQLQVMDPAVVPDRPMSRHVVRNAAIAGTVGLLLCAIAVLFLDALAAASARGRSDQPSVVTSSEITR